VAYAWGETGQINNHAGIVPCALFLLVFTCELLQVIARTAPFDESSLFFLLSDLLAITQLLKCLNAKAIDYHKFVYAGHQQVNHQLWAAGICGLLRKYVGRVLAQQFL